MQKRFDITQSPASMSDKPISRATLFRPSVYARNGVAVDGAVLRISLPSLGRVTLVAAIFCALLAAFLYFGEYTRREKVSGIVLSGLGAVRVYAPTNGTIVRRFVKEGDFVREGQAMFAISTERSTSQLGNTQEIISLQLQHRKLAFERDLVQRKKLYMVEARKLENLVEAGENQNAQIDREIALAGLKVRNVESAWERYQSLARSGFTSDAALLDKEQEVVSQKMQYASLDRQRENLKKDTESFRSEILELKHRNELEISALNRSIAEIDQLLAGADAQREILVTAQSAGIVTSLTVDKGQVVGPASMMVAILPAGDVHDVHLYVPSRAIGFVKPGSIVMLRFDSFPYQKFGQYRGVVQEVGKAPLSAREIQTTLPGSEDFFRVLVTADQASVSAYGNKVALQNGMKLEADLLLDTRRIYEWALEPLLGFGVRVNA